MSEPLLHSSELVREGKQLLEQLDVANVLSRFGRVTIDGSLEYELMVKPDIDIGVWSDQPALVDAAEAAKYFAAREDVRRTFVSNHLNFESRLSHQPRGVYLGLNVPVEDRMWNFDIWFLSPGSQATMEGLKEDWFKSLSDEQRVAILELKHTLVNIGEYGDTIYSADVYRSVVLGGVRDIDGIKRWLRVNK